MTLDRDPQNQRIGTIRQAGEHRHQRIGENQTPTHELITLSITRSGHRHVEAHPGADLRFFHRSIDRIRAGEECEGHLPVEHADLVLRDAFEPLEEPPSLTAADERGEGDAGTAIGCDDGTSKELVDQIRIGEGRDGLDSCDRPVGIGERQYETVAALKEGMNVADTPLLLAAVDPDLITTARDLEQRGGKGVQGRHIEATVAVGPRAGQHEIDLPPGFRQHGRENAETVASTLAEALAGGHADRHFAVPALDLVDKRSDQGSKLVFGRIPNQHLAAPLSQLGRRPLHLQHPISDDIPDILPADAKSVVQPRHQLLRRRGKRLARHRRHVFRPPVQHPQVFPVLLAVFQPGEIAVDLEVDLMRHQEDVLGKAECPVGVGKTVDVGRQVPVARGAGGADPGNVLLLDHVPRLDIRQRHPARAGLDLARNHNPAVRFEHADLEDISIRQWLQHRGPAGADRRVGAAQPVVVIQARAVGEYPLDRLIQQKDRVDIGSEVAVSIDKVAAIDLERREERLGTVAPRKRQKLQIRRVAGEGFFESPRLRLRISTDRQQAELVEDPQFSPSLPSAFELEPSSLGVAAFDQQ